LKRVFIIPIFILFCSFTILGQSNLQSIIQAGVSKTYNMEFDAAEKIFNRAIEKYPKQPHGYFRTAQLHFWLFLGTRDQGEYYVFLKFADLAQKRIDKILDEDEKNYRIQYMAGSLNSYKAMAYATNNSTVDALWASKKSVGYYEETLELNKRYYDAYLGLGIFDYAMGFVPDFLKWAVNLTGLSSDKDRGLSYIKTAFNKGTEKAEAAFHLAKIYTDYLADYDSAYYYLNYNLERYPGNTLFIYQYAVTLIKDHKLDRANELLSKIIKINNTKIPQIISLAHFRKGEILFKKNNFKAAVKEYDKFLSTTKEIDFIGIAAFNAAICYKFLGNDEECKNYLDKVSEGNQDIFEDSYAMSKSQHYKSNGIPEEDLMLIRMRNDFETGKVKAVYDSFKTVPENFHSNIHKALALIYFSDAALKLEKHSEANDACEKIKSMSMSLSSEKWIIPKAYLNMALANYHVGEKIKAVELLQEADENNDYEFKDRIQALIENLKRKLNKK
jgi:tetratricopeptide (TPR) repeat protein